MIKDKVIFSTPNQQEGVELPVYTSGLGKPVIDIAGLPASGFYTFDPGFVSTASCSSKITYIDGQQGILRYRGYPIEELAEHSSYLETCYLLLFGELPSEQQLENFTNSIDEHSNLSEEIVTHIKAFDPKIHPMAMLCAAVNVLAGQYHADIDINNADNRIEVAVNLVAKLPLIAALCFRHANGKADLPIPDNISYIEKFLYLLGDSDAKLNQVFVDAVDLLFILHADHEQNASTSAVRLAGSSGANPYSCIGAGVATLWGPAHGGANEAVLQMLSEIEASGGNIDKFINKAKDKNDPFKLMGFGHRVYKNFDPRAKIVRDMCYKVLDHAEQDPIFHLARELEQHALADEYFIEKKLYPNVDFYSGIIMRALGIPTNMFTVMFALGRCIGWISHWHEMLSEPYRIGRPRQLYTGYDQRSYPKQLGSTANLF